LTKRVLILILGLAGFTVMADNWVISPLLPAISNTFGTTATNAGVLITAYMIPFGIFQLVFGPLADRFGKRQVITFAMAFFTVGTALCAFAFDLGNLTLYRALTGVFAASVMPVSLALIGDLVPLAERQAAIGSFMGISFLGQGLSMAIGGGIAYLFNWRGAFILYAVLAIISTALLLTAGKKIPSTRNPHSEFIEPYVKLITNRESLFTYMTVFFEGLLIIGAFSYIGAFISNQYHYNFLQIGLIMTAFGVMTIIGGRVSGKLATKLGKKTLILSGLISAVLADFILFATGNVLIALIAGVALLGLGFIFTHSTLLTIATEFAQKSRGVAMSLVAACFMAGGGIGTAIGGKLIKAHGFADFFLYGALALIVLVGAVALLIKDASGQPKNNTDRHLDMGIESANAK
jgi:predicted MFS family arabinose efflux permease